MGIADSFKPARFRKAVDPETSSATSTGPKKTWREKLEAKNTPESHPRHSPSGSEERRAPHELPPKRGDKNYKKGQNR